MSFPDYIPTRVIRFGGATGQASGTQLCTKVVVKSSKSLVHDASGYRFESDSDSKVSLPGAEVEFVLPTTDTPGMRDADLNAIIDVSAPNSYTHQYTATISFELPGGKSAGTKTYTIGPFVLPKGDNSVVDGDKLVGATNTVGQAVSIPDQWSAMIADLQTQIDNITISGGLPDGAVTDAKVSNTAAISADKLADGTTKKVMTSAERTKLSGVATGATANDTDANLKNRANHTGTQSADTLTDGTTNKLYTSAEKTKLAGVATGATANSTDAQLRDRSTHTGTQSADTLVDGITNKVFTAAEKTKLAGITGSGGTYNDTENTAAIASGVYQTSGGKILDPYGRNIVPVGLHITVPSLGDNGTSLAHSADLTNLWSRKDAAGAIISRPNLVYLDCGVVNDASLPSWWPARTLTTNVVYKGETMFTWERDILQRIDEYTAAGYIVVVVSRDALQAGSANLANVAKSQQIVDFFVWIADKYKTNPLVWLNPHCEPPYWDQNWCDIHNPVVDAVRTVGYMGPIILDPPGAGQDLGPEYTVFNTNGTTWLQQVAGTNYGVSGITNKYNLINGVHWYGWPSWQRTYATALTYVSNHTAAGYPVILGEMGAITTAGAWGAVDADTTDRVKATHVAFDLIRAKVIGGCWWHGHHPDGFYLNTTGQFWTMTSGNLTWAGQKFLDVIGAQV